MAKERLLTSRTLLITYGLSEVWKRRFSDSMGYVNNLPPKVIVQNKEDNKYESILASYTDVFTIIRKTIELVRTYIGNKITIIMTVSPVPLKFTFSGLSVREANNISKSVLLLAVRDACKNFNNVFYFPSYEIVQGLTEENFDDVWQPDCRHITAKTIDYIASKFCSFSNFQELSLSSFFFVPFVNAKGNIIGKLYVDGSTDIT